VHLLVHVRLGRGDDLSGLACAVAQGHGICHRALDVLGPA
jgi:hypothetical protein